MEPKKVTEMTDDELYAVYGRIQMMAEQCQAEKQVIRQELANRQKPIPDKPDNGG